VNQAAFAPLRVSSDIEIGVANKKNESKSAIVHLDITRQGQRNKDRARRENFPMYEIEWLNRKAVT
jgi:hypothetical protein